MSKREVRAKGRKIFQKIQKLVSLLVWVHAECPSTLSKLVCFPFSYMQFQELEELGYQGFAVALYKECTELVGTRMTVNCFNPALIEYLHAIIVSGTE